MAKVQIQLKLPQNTNIVQRDLLPWDGQIEILQNTGIERDGGITNLYSTVNSDTNFDETIYCKNGNKVQLKKDPINNNFRVFSKGVDVGQCPLWGVKSRTYLPSDANDIIATIDNTYLVLKILNNVAYIEEVDASFNRIQIRSFNVPAGTFDGCLVRNKAPTWANVTSIGIVYASGGSYQYSIYKDSGVEYQATINAIIGSLVAYYENAWILSINTFDGNNDIIAFVTSTGGTGVSINGAQMYLTADYNQGTGKTVFHASYYDGSSTDWITITPPVIAGHFPTISTATQFATSSAMLTFGGIGYTYLSGVYKFVYKNTLLTKLKDVGHFDTPEIYGVIDTGADVIVKEHTILGMGSYLSMSFAHDGIGVPITEIGEIGAKYCPQQLKKTNGDYAVVYRRGDGSFVSAIISPDLTFSRLTELSPGIVKINTASAANVIDTVTNELQFGGNAYNGFVIVAFNAVAPSAKAYVARIRNDVGGSVDTNYKNAGSVGAVTSVEIVEGRFYTPVNDAIDIYVGAPPSSLAYYRSVRSYTYQFIDNAKFGTIYVDDLLIPPPINTAVEDRTFNLLLSTAIREKGKDSYILTNEIPGVYVSFSLYGNLYLFDGQWIYIVSLANTTVTRYDRVAIAQGLVFIAEAPTAIFFLSTFDNSIYTFDGGQTVNKVHRYNRAEPIEGGIYNVRENTLALFSDSSVFWVRDGLISQTHLPFSWPFEAFSTDTGIWIVKDKYSIRYVYNPAPLGIAPTIALTIDGGVWGTAYADIYDGGTWGTSYADSIDGGAFGGDGANVEPLTWQSKFLGIDERTAQKIERVLFRFFKEDKVQTDITITYDYFTEDGQFSETQIFTVGDMNNPWDSEGYAYIEFVPQQKRSVGASFTMTCPLKVVFLDSFAEVVEDSRNVAKNRK